jgi:hypothetical protein
MFKLNPLGENFVCEDRYDADMKSSLHICNDEFIFIGQNILEAIFKIPLPVYLFLLLLLCACYLKMKDPTLKKRRLAVPVVILPFLLWAIWLFQSHTPLKKVYTSDGQYSYYLEEYNYNAVLEKIIPPFFYETDYKVFIYDEVSGRKLCSGYAGGKTLMSNYFGFDEEGAETRFHFTKPDYIILPRPVDPKAIERQQRKEKQINDSIRMVQQYNELPFISEQDINYIQPVIQKWLDFYNIDITQMKHNSLPDWKPPYAEPFAEKPDTLSPYYRSFTKDDDRSNLPIIDYSPDKKRYIDTDIPCFLEDDGKYHFLGGEDFSIAYLVDRKKRGHFVIWWSGISGNIQAAFWKDNDVFILTGWERHVLEKRFIQVYDLKNKTFKRYEILVPERDEHKSYTVEVVMKEKGIIIN